MRVSPDAVLFGLRLLGEGALDPAELAAELRAVAAGDVPDQLVALEERLLARHRGLEEAVSRAAAEPHFVPLDCPGCRARFRVWQPELGAESYCPLCGEAIVAGRRLLFLAGHAPCELRAAEAETAYVAAPPRRFAHFELIRLAGRGGAGKVYEARNTRTGRTVALKLLEFRPVESAAAAMRRLRREAKAASSVGGEHVVPVHDLGVAEGLSYVEMEFVEGTSLREHVRREGALAPQQAVRLCRETLAGLEQVHAAGIVHRDVKPANILIDARGRARLTDFGLSRFLEETTTLSGSEKLVGSPHFMAPEQWRGGPLSAPTDLYAMGMVLYHALTGRLPYEEANLVALMYRHLHEPLLPPGEPQPFAEHLADVIRRATAKAPDERFPTAAAFAAALLGK